MSRDMRDPMRANVGFAANMLKHIIPGYSLVGACNEIGVAQRNRYIRNFQGAFFRYNKHSCSNLTFENLFKHRSLFGYPWLFHIGFEWKKTSC